MVAPFFRVLLLADGTIAAQSPRKDFGTSRFRAVRDSILDAAVPRKGPNDLPAWTLKRQCRVRVIRYRKAMSALRPLFPP